MCGFCVDDVLLPYQSGCALRYCRDSYILFIIAECFMLSVLQLYALYRCNTTLCCTMPRDQTGWVI